MTLLLLVLGTCSWVGKELSIDGVYQRRFPAQSYSGVLGGMEYGESGRDSSLSNCKVSTVPYFLDFEDCCSFYVLEKMLFIL